MKYSTETFTRQISWLQALKLETWQRLSYTLSCMGQEMPKSEASLEEQQRMVNALKKSSSEIRHLLQNYENELEWRQEEVMFLAWISEGSMYDQHTRP